MKKHSLQLTPLSIRITSVFFFIILLGAYANIFAIGSPYQPGSTLDPACIPGETNCIVQIIPSQTSNANKYLTTDGTSTSWSTQTLILAGNLTTSGAYATTLTTTGTTTLTLPTTGTLATTSNINTAVSGTTNYIPKFTGTNTIGNSLIFDDGTNVGVGTSTPGTKLSVTGTQGVVNTTIRQLGIVNIYDDTTADIDVGAVLTLGGKYNSSGTYSVFGAIKSGKTVATDSWADGYLSFHTTANTGVLSEKMRISSAGNVGIGTASPYRKLEIAGAGAVLAFAPGDTSALGANAVLNSIQARSNLGALDATSAAEIKFLTGSDVYYKGQIAFYTNNIDSTASAAVERMRITSDGNVGIGTMGPTGDTSRILDIYGATGSGIFFHDGVGGTTTTDGGTLQQGGSNTYLYNRENGPLIFGTNNTEVMRIDASGNIIIPDLSGSGNRCVYADSTGQINVKGFDCGSASGGDNLGDHTATQNVLLGANWLSSDGGNEGIRIDASGNVGVGTGSPGARLEVNRGGVNGVGILNLSGGVAYSTISWGRTSIEASLATAQGSNQFFTGAVAGDTWFGSTNGTIGIGNDTSGIANLTIKGGNVGIGTTAPGDLLHINASAATQALIRISVGGSVYSYYGVAGSADNIIAGSTLGDTVVRAQGNNILFSTDSGTTANVYIKNGGNVGIGTATPGYKLEVTTSASATYTSLIKNTSATGYGLNVSAGSTSTSSYPFVVDNQSTNLFVVRGDGNVGIGTASPGYPLVIDSSVNNFKLNIISRDTGTGASIQLDSSNSGGKTWQIFSSASSNGTIGGNNFAIRDGSGISPDSASYRFLIDTNGNVGIGTTSPDTTFHINHSNQTSGNYENKGLMITENAESADGLVAYTRSSGEAYIGLNKDLSASAGYLIFGMNLDSVGNKVDALTIRQSGNVGIGTTTPISKLVVSNAGALGYEIDPTADAGETIQTLTYNRSTTAYKKLSQWALSHELRVNGGDLALTIASDQSATFASHVNLGNAKSLQWSGGAIINSTSSDMKFYTGGSSTLALTIATNQAATFSSTVRANSAMYIYGDSSNTIGQGSLIQIYNSVAGRGWIAQLNASQNLDLWHLGSGGGWSNVGTFNGSTGAYTALSDVNKKKNFEIYTGGLVNILALKSTLYNMKDQADGTPKELGFIAQEVRDVIPQAYVENGDFIGLNYSAFTPVIVKAIQEMNLKIEDINNMGTENSYRDSLIAWLANAENRITRIFTGEICLTDPGQQAECINRAQLQSLKALLNESQTPTPPPADPTCSDNIQNQDETGIDEGGICTPTPTPEPEPEPEPNPEQTPPPQEEPTP